MAMLVAGVGAASSAQAQDITTSNLGANQVTLNLTADNTGTGYFTVLSGSGATCGDAAQTAAGKDSTGTGVRHGSLALTANTAGQYTVRNLWQSRAYTVCFTPDGSTAPDSLSFTTNSEATFSGPTWNAVGSFPTGASYYTGIAFTPDGTPYVGYSDASNSNVAKVVRFNGSAWEAVGSALSAGYTSYNIIAISPSGIPYVAYSTGQSGTTDNGRLTVKRWNSALSSWETVGSADFSPSAAIYPSLAFAPDGSPWIAYTDEGNLSRAIVERFNGTSWEYVGGADFTAGLAQHFTLAFSPDGTPYLSYGANGVKATVVRFNGTSWEAVGTAGFSAGQALYTSLSFSADGTPYVAYEDGGNSNKVTVMQYNGSSWTVVGTAGFSAGISTYVKLAFSPDGVPYVSYVDTGNGRKSAVVRFNGTSWETVASTISSGTSIYTSLAFSPDGTPYVSYADSPPTDQLTVKKLTSAVTGPIATTGTATSLTSSSATLNGTVNDDGVDTAVTFDYGTTTSYGTNVAATTGGSIVAGTGNTAVAVSVASLQPGTTYHFRVNATGNGTTVHGSDATFTTDKETPSVSSWPTASAITLGQSLAASVLSGGSSPVPGAFDWADKTSVPSTAGLWSESAIFTPTDTTRYNTTSHNVIVLVNPPTPATAAISTSNLSASQVTLNLTSSVAGTGYFTVLAGSSATCGTATRTAAGQDSTGTPVLHGSLPLAAGTAGNYTLRNLKESAAYTVCFTPDGTTPPSSSTFTTLAGKSLSSATWNAVGAIPYKNSGNDLPSLTFASDGTPYVAFVDYENGQKVTVMRFDGSSWQLVGNADFTPTRAGYAIPAFSPDGTLYLAYTNASSTGNANVMRFNGTSWEPVGNSNFTYGSDYPSLAFSPDGTPYLAYEDIELSRRASVMKFDRASSTWVQVGSQGFSSGQAPFTTLAFALDGSPYMAYEDGNPGKATVKRFDGSNWVNVGTAGFSAGTGSVSFAFSPDGVPYVGVNSSTDPDVDSSTAAVMKFDGSSWNPVGPVGFTDAFDSTESTSMGFAPDGTAYFLYTNYPDFQLKAMRFNGNAWENAGSTVSDPNSFEPSLTISPDGTPYASFIECPDICHVVIKRLVLSAPVGPTATTGAASAVSSAGATLNGTVNDNGSATTVAFEYGTDASYGTAVTATTPSGGTVSAGSGNTSVSVGLTGLSANQTYHFRVNATSGGNTVHGSDATFTTDKATPSVTTWPTASSISYGQSLTSSMLTGGVANVGGTFAWNDSTTVPSSGGTSSYSVLFTPTDMSTYATVTHSVSVTVNKAAPTIAWSNPADITYGTTISPAELNARATGVNGESLAGTFSYSVGIGTKLNAGSGQTLSVTFTPSDGTNYTTATKSVMINVTKAAQTISFNNPGSQNFGTTPTVTATSTSALTVTFSSSSAGVCTITSGGTLTFISAGTCTINADQPGNTNYTAAATVTQNFAIKAVAPNAPTIGTATAGDAKATVSFTAPASNGGGAITGYTVTSSPGGFIGTGISSPITVTGLTNGIAYTFTVTATNSAGAGPASAASNSISPKGSQTITFLNPGSQTFGTTPRLIATSSAGLTVSFTSSTTSVCTVTTSGALTFVSTGTCTINADQAGNGSYHAATTVTQSFTVQAASQTISFAQPASPVTYGVSPIALSATATSGQNPVFSVISGPGAINGASLTVTGAGTIVVAADQSGNSNYNAATQVTHSIVVNKSTPNIAWSNPASITYGTALSATQLNASATGVNSAALTGTFTYTPASGTVLSAGNAQTLSVSFTPSDSTNYTAATKTASISVTAASQAITFTQPASPITYGSTASVNLVATGGPGSKPVTFTVVSGPGTINGPTLTINGAGTIVVAANQAGDANYAAAPQVTRNIVIARASATLTGQTAQPVFVVYAQAGSISESIAGQYAGMGTTAPSGVVNYTINNSSNIPVASGSLTISSGAVTIPVASTLAPGIYTVSSSYAGDTNYAPLSTPLTIDLQIGQIQPTITWTPVTSITYGAPLANLLTAQAYNGSSKVAGSYSYSLASSPVTGSTVLTAGSYTLMVKFTPTDSATYKTATANVMLVVNKATPAASIAASMSNVLVQNPITLTATVNSSASTPTGTVIFLDGTMQIGASPLANGIATLVTSSLAVGTHSITAVYSGDANFVTVTTTATPVQVNDFDLHITSSSTDSTSQTVLPGGTAAYNLMLTPTGRSTFPADVQLSVSGLPSGATYTLTPQTIASGSGATAVTLAVTAPRLTAMHRTGKKLAPFAFALLLLPFGGRLRRNAGKLGRLTAMLLLLSGGSMAVMGLTGCGANNGYFGQPQQTYTITVTGTSGTLQHSTSVTLTIQ